MLLKIHNSKFINKRKRGRKRKSKGTVCAGVIIYGSKDLIMSGKYVTPEQCNIVCIIGDFL